MRRIPTLFAREARVLPNGKKAQLAIPELTEDCEWVLQGLGVATEKFDGSACLVFDGRLWRRHRHKAEKGDPPKGWLHWSTAAGHETFEPLTSGHGWIPVDEVPADRWHLEAWRADGAPRKAGTYELVGPKLQGNPYALDRHELWRHGSDRHPAGYEFVQPIFPHSGDLIETFEYLRDFLRQPIEGIVWHHPDDGRMAKLKRADFGYKWPMIQEPAS